jgi:hypothetical protein
MPGGSVFLQPNVAIACEPLVNESSSFSNRRGQKDPGREVKMKKTDARLLSNLPTYADEGAVHAVVEEPKGSGVKSKYDENWGPLPSLALCLLD